MELRLLGQLEVVHQGRRADLTARRERSVLTFLLVEVNRVVPVDRLIERVWNGETPESANITLRVLVSRLRRGLSAIGIDDLVLTRSPGYVIELPTGSYDIEMFETLAADGRNRLNAGDMETASIVLRQAVALWRGPAFGELADHPALCAEAARLEEERLVALEACIDADLARGRHGAVVAELEAACADHPLRERFWAQRMLALYRCGRQADALRAFQALRLRLTEELGLEPSGPTRRLDAAIARQDPELDLASTDDHPASARATMTILSAKPFPEEARAIVTEHGGDQADANCATFATASDATNAALQLQRLVRSRIALHSGEVHRTDGRLRGVVLDRALRMARVAHPGQVLASSSVFHLVRDLVPDGVSFVDLGYHRLDDLAAPERLYQVEVDGFADQFPPLPSLDTRHHNLPLQATSFVGRASDLDGLTSSIEQYSLVTIVGSAGVGKTRLALQAAAAMLSQFPDGVRVCALASVQTGDAVAAALATALGSGHGTDGISEHVADKSLLLVIDNCEHVVDKVAELAALMVAADGPSRTLVTSREALGVDGELIWQARPLEPDDAVQLFVERARAGRRDFNPSDDDLSTITAICRRLDGIPLAIELAAARARFMSPTEIESRLDERFRLLTGGSRIGLERHRTLRAAVTWSYDLLAPEERLVLDRLAVFVSGFDARSAENVVGGHDIDAAEVLDLLSSLVAKSTIEVDTAESVTRYRLLETIRDLGLERLTDRGELDAMRRSHAEHFARLVAEAGVGMRTPDEQRWMDWLEHELDEISAALRWAVDAGDAELALSLCAPLYIVPYFFSPTGREIEIGAWAEEALTVEDARMSSRYAEACAWAAIGRYARGDQEGTDHFVSLGHRAADVVDVPANVVLSAMEAFRSLTSGDWAGGATIIRAAVEASPDAPASELGPLFAGLAVFASASGDRIATEYAAARAKELAETLGTSARSLISAMVGTALAAFDEDEALVMLQDAVVLDARHTAWSDMARTQIDNILAHREGTSTPDFRLRLEELTRSGRRFGGVRVLAAWLSYLAGALADLGRDEEAAALFGIIDAGCIAAWSMPPVDADRVQRARARLGDAAFTAAHGRGASMTYDEATAFALACVPDAQASKQAPRSS